jgi:hypothetical protein
VVPESRPVVSRRDVLKVGGSVTLVQFATFVGIVSHARPADADTEALEFKSIDRRQARLLICMTRTLFPHDFLPDAQYLKIVSALDVKAGAAQDIGTMIKSSLAAFPVDFAAMTEPKRADYLRSIERSPFFQFVYKETLVGLYGDPYVTTLLGYEGSSVEHGGYLQRGFDDISWLPQSAPAQP